MIEEEVVDTRGIEAGGATNDAMHLVPLLEQQLRPGNNKRWSIDTSHTSYVQILTNRIHPGR